MANARLNIEAHYDISNAMFAAFLSDDMTYSCPMWASASDPKSAEETLESAQCRKLRYFIGQAKIKRTDHVLEIGTGWGSFAIEAVKTTGCRVTSLTLSREQKELADERIAAAGYAENIEVLLCDYRALPMPNEGPYDKVVSIEMLEAVGREYLQLYFNCVHKLLKPDGGIGVFQCITMPEARYEAYSSGEDFIRKYIFPGGHLPSVSQLVSNIDRGSEGHLVVDDIKNIGGHYAKTLRLWRQKFEQNFDTAIRPALLSEHKGMTDRDTELFKRKWQASSCKLLQWSRELIAVSITSPIAKLGLIRRQSAMSLSLLVAKARQSSWRAFLYEREVISSLQRLLISHSADKVLKLGLVECANTRV